MSYHFFGRGIIGLNNPVQITKQQRGQIMKKLFLLGLLLVAPSFAVDIIRINTPAVPAMTYNFGSRYTVDLRSAGVLPSPQVKIAQKADVNTDYISITSRKNTNITFGTTEVFQPLTNSRGLVSLILEDKNGSRISASRCFRSLKKMPTVRLRVNLGASASYTNTTCPDVQWQVTSAECGSPGCKVLVRMAGNISNNSQLAITTVTGSGTANPSAGLADNAIAKFSGKGYIRWEFPLIVEDGTEQLYDFSLGSDGPSGSGGEV